MIDFDRLDKKAHATVCKECEIYEEAARFNTRKVLAAFKKACVADYYLKPSTGYAYSDVGRDKLSEIYADIFRTEAALIRSQFVSGTHALAVALLGNLRAGDEMIAATGTPYDTMQTVIGTPTPVPASLCDIGVIYKEIPMAGSKPDIKKLTVSISDSTKLVHIQRSCGYSSTRNTLSVEEIGDICAAVKAVKPDCICFVDNCYGEFVEKQEPTEVGADLIAGSLIKNLGGGFAPTGGYIAGRADLVEAASYRLTAPGLGGEMGATLGDTAREFYQGLFMAPHVVLQAVKTAIYAAYIFAELGFDVKPSAQDERYDIIQAITLKEATKLCKFCEAIQSNSPIDSHVKPIPSHLPGYADEIIMAAGTFVQGASIELSADGPMREPFNVFFQGGLTYEHGRIAILEAAKAVELSI